MVSQNESSLSEAAQRFRGVAPACDGWSLRLVRDASQGIAVRNDVLEPLRTERDAGAMVSVVAGGGMGYAATSDLTMAGLQGAAARALAWARLSAGRCATTAPPASAEAGSYRSVTARSWRSRELSDIVAQLRGMCARLKRGDAIADRVAALEHRETETVLVTGAGGSIAQRFSSIQPYLMATANRGSHSQTRSFGKDAGRQGGFEQLDALGFEAAVERTADEALALLDAPDCPTGTMTWC
jgi:predicted Zn-dependent protease